MKYLEIINKNLNELSEKEKIFVNLHKEIMNDGNNIANNLIQLANHLKEMRDSKNFEVAGFDNFSDYVENAVGIKERQAYNYINVVERLNAEFLHSNAKIGITKLLELSKIDNKEMVEEIVKNNNLEEITVSKLKEEISEYKDKLENLEYQNSELLDKLENLQGNTYNEVIDEEKTKLKDEINKLKSEIETLNTKEPEVKVVKDDETIKKLKETNLKLKSLQQELDEKTKQLQMTSDPAVEEFKFKYIDVQNLINNLKELILKANEDNKKKLIKAFEALKELIVVC